MNTQTHFNFRDTPPKRVTRGKAIGEFRKMRQMVGVGEIPPRPVRSPTSPKFAAIHAAIDAP